MSINECSGTELPKLLTDHEVSDALRVSKVTLSRWRGLGEGPPFVRVGPRQVRYVESEFRAWFEASKARR